MGAKKRKQAAGQTIGGMLVGFDQQVMRTLPPGDELVHHARPDDPVPAADGTLVSITLPEPGTAADLGAADGEEPARP